ncbi:MAG: GDSL-type esterase/lipase family protein [Planctomycetaceae bacterium]|nr:GDSL-type esterase/lipase family protein [Planctomycetaceae bacterium]
MKIMCLGDSLTFGTGVTRPNAWTTLVHKQTGCELVNRGVPGDTTGGMLARFVNEIERHRPNMVVVMGGSNDIFSSGDDKAARANITALAHQTSARAMTPVVCAPPPLDPTLIDAAYRNFFDVDAAQACLRDYALWLRRFTSFFSIPFVDFWSSFTAPAWRVQDEKLSVDGLHPSRTGHILMAEVFMTTMGDTFSSVETA